MALFIWIFAALVVLNVLLLVFSNSLRTSYRQRPVEEKAPETGYRVFNIKAGETVLKKAV
jgi:hypothetical protein